MTPALITGATGFLGLHLAERLCADGVAVRALVRRESLAGAAAQQLSAMGVQLIPGDLHDQAALREAVAGVAQVFHLAGRLLKPGQPESLYHETHVEGTRRLLLACAEVKPARVIHCSTTGVLGPTGETPRDENSPIKPDTIYEISKAAGEQIALAMAAEHGLALSVARPALVYGPGDLHMLGWFRSIQRGIYRVVGRGDNLLHPIYISDLVTGLLRCAEVPAAVGRVYHLVGPRPVPISELAAAIAAALGRRLPRIHLPLPLARAAAIAFELAPLPPERLPLTRSRVDFMTQSRAYCGCRARDELGFRAEVELAEGLRRTVAWYRREGLL